MRKEIRKVSQRNLVFILTINSTNYWRCYGSALRPLRETMWFLNRNIQKKITLNAQRNTQSIAKKFGFYFDN